MQLIQMHKVVIIEDFYAELIEYERFVWVMEEANKVALADDRVMQNRIEYAARR